METIKVNMNPNPLDVQTIHASQNDGKARQWGFELHNNGDVIDSSEVTDQMVFKAYKGGTEQLLPENTSTPTTSPFKGDIRYPQGLLSDQEFTYRQSPTEEDGLAKITDIKGNTLNWNQLVQNGNFESIDGWGKTRVTLSASSNVLTATVSEASTGRGQRVFKNLGINDEHTRLYTCEIKATSGIKVNLGSNTVDVAGYTILATDTANGDWQKLSAISSLNHAYILIGLEANTSVGDSYQIRNVQVFDLTLMGLDISNPSDFTSLFPLSYYSYNQGSLLSFMGNGIKTVGFNQWDEEWEVGAITAQGTPSITADRIRSKNFIPAEPNTRYFRKTPNNLQPFFYDENQQFIEYGFWGIGNFTTPSNCAYIKFQVDPVYGLTYKNDICINISDAKRNGTYEPYTSSTLSLPISTYFPDGMDGIGDVHDEKNETGYVKRIGTITFDGSENWAVHGSIASWFYIDGYMVDAKYVSNTTPLKNRNTGGYEAVGYTSAGGLLNMQFTFNPTSGISGGSRTIFKNTSYTTVDQWKTYLQNHPITISYELSTPLENYGVVDLGTLDWIYNDSFKRFHSTGLSSLAKFPSNDTTVANILSNDFATVSAEYFNNNKTVDKLVALSMYGSIYARNLSITDVNEFKSSLSGVYLLYEKKNPQGFTTATLVTENGEVALANENGVLVGKCNSDVSADAGFIEGKIKLTDEDGECYSNKIQLHVERSPQ